MLEKALRLGRSGVRAPERLLDVEHRHGRAFPGRARGVDPLRWAHRGLPNWMVEDGRILSHPTTGASGPPSGGPAEASGGRRPTTSAPDAACGLRDHVELSPLLVLGQQ